MTPTGNTTQPEIKFRWCRTVRCRAQEVWLVLTSVTGTRVALTWDEQLGWYEAPPTPIPCGLHTGFILIQDKARDASSGTLRARERDYKIDPFHIVSHKFAVELFLQSDHSSPFWSDVPELRLRYLSSDHLERLGASTRRHSPTDHESGRLTGRKWVSSTTLSCVGDQGRREAASYSTSKDIVGPNARSRARPRGLTRGRSHSQLRASSRSFDNLKDQGEASISSPNLSRAFQVAVDLSRASSKFLAGLSSTSSGVCLGFEDGSDPPSPDTKHSANINSPYAAGGETSQDSEDAGGARRKKILYTSRDRSLRIEDLTGEGTWSRRARGSTQLDESKASSSSYEDLLAGISSTRRATFKTELNILRFDTLAQERLVKEILAPSDSDFEDEEGACEASESDLAGHYGCVITFESRSSSMDDVGSPRALEDVLVSLTSNESHPEVTYEPSQVQEDSSSVKEHNSESNLETPSSSEGRHQPTPRTITPTSCSEASSSEIKASSTVPFRLNTSPVSELVVSVEAYDSELGPPPDSSASVHEEKHLEDDERISGEEASDTGGGQQKRTPRGEGLTTSAVGGRGSLLTPDIDDDNFQYESLKHEDEHLPIDIRNIDSEESLEPIVSKPHVGGNVEDEGEPYSRPDSAGEESGGSGVYEVEGAQPTFSSVDGEVPTDSLTQVTTNSQKVTVREVKDIDNSKSDTVLPGDEREHVSEARGAGTVTSEQVDVPNSSEEAEQIIAEDLGDESETVSAVIKPRVTFDGSMDAGGPTSRVVGDGETVYERDYLGRDSTDGDRQRTLIGGDRGRTMTGSEEGRTLPAGDRGRTLAGSDEGRILFIADKGKSIRDVVSDFFADGGGGRFLTGAGGVRTNIRGDSGRAESGGAFKSRHDRGRKWGTPSSESRGQQQDPPAAGDSTVSHLDHRDSENRQPHLRPVRLQNAGTQTTQTKHLSKMTSTRSFKLSEGEGAATSTTTKYSRSPLRNRTNGQAESPYTPLPDRLNGPWSQRHSKGPTAPPPPSGVSELATLQRNLYNLVQAHEALQVGHNTLHLRHLQSELRLPRGYHTSHAPPLAHHTLPSGSPTRNTHHHHHHHQSSTNHHHQATAHHHHHRSPVHHQSPVHHHYSHPSPTHHPSPTYLPKYPVLNSTIVQSSTSMAYYNLRSNPTSRSPGDRSGRVKHVGSASDLSRLQHTTTFSQHTGGASSIRSASSLPDLHHTAPGHLGPARTTLFTHDNPGPTHAHSAFDVMVGSGRSAGKRGTYWDSDSGGSTDSLIDEAEHITTTPLDPNIYSVYSPAYDGEVRHRKRHRQHRRRTRSHQGGFSSWRGDTDAATLGAINGRPYLPYRGDQLSPGQQVKVLAPGGGVAVARVLTHQKSSWQLVDKSSRASSLPVSPASVTVILLSEPNRLQGSVVTVPLEKVLLAWPRT